MPTPVPERPDPEVLLRQVQAEERYTRRGRLKVFLGYASGVGKSFRMLDEARRRNERGEDVVVAAVQPRVPPEVEPVLSKLEQIPTLSINGKQPLNLPAILRRRPGVCVIDGLAHDNPPGAPHPSRYQDIEELLESGINVLTSVNLQYIRELQAEVQAITGKQVTETVPVDFLNAAYEIEVVDAPPEAADPRLSQLREMALVLAAKVVDHQLEQYLVRHGLVPAWGAQERILVCLTPRANARAILTSARRNADRFHGELFAVYVRQSNMTPQDQAAIEAHLSLSRRIGARVEILEGDEPVEAILQFARSHGITQIFVGHSKRSGWFARWTGGPVDLLLDEATDMDVRVFPQ